MTNDTMKSLGYLEKSLKMSKRAIEKNMDEDNVKSDRFDEMNGAIDKVMDLIKEWRNMNSVIISPTSITSIPVSLNDTTSIPLDSLDNDLI